jgi:hypothetical protein
MFDLLAEASRLPPMLDVIKGNPHAFAVGCVVWIPVAIWVYSMISWMVLGEIDVIFGTAAVGLALVLGFLTSSPTDPRMAPLFFVAIISMICVWPFLLAGANARIEWISRIDEVERAYERLDSNAKDPGALFKLANALRKFGLEGAAIRMGEQSVAKLDKKYFGQYIEEVEKWKSSIADPDPFRPTQCPACKMKNGPGIPYCPRCGEKQYLAIANQFWRPQSFAGRIIGAWIAGLSAAILIPLVAGAPWPQPLKIMAISGLVILGGFILVRSIVMMAKDRQI